MANTTSIDNQVWEILNSVNREIAEEKRAQKNGEARVAQANRPTSKEQAALDRIVPAIEGEEPSPQTLVAASKQETPTLPAPTTAWNGVQDGKTPGLIALIGTVLALQAKTNSTFWSTLWKQASESMMMQVKFAPIIGDAVRESYDAQADATRADATQAFATAFIDLGSFAMSVFAGGMMEYKDPQFPEGQGKTITAQAGLKNEGEEAADQALNKSTAETALNEEKTEIQNQITDNSWATSVKRFASKVWTGANNKRQSLTGLLFKLSGVSSGFAMLSQGSTAAVTAHYQGVKADAQGKAGQASAIEKESEQYAQFYGQSFSRTDTLNQASQQFIDSAMGILKSAADGVTQVVTSMFRG